MASKRIGILAGGALAGALLLGTAGLAFAQDPTPTSGAGSSSGAGMMGGQGAAGMMGGQGAAGMMGGAMDHGSLTPEQLQKMDALHDQMVASGTCDPAQMQQLHTEIQSGS
jgi:Spy/CpxP family protein refolding chaperone